MAYSSKYYDPVKAHEYYLKHRKLKGRKKKKGVSLKGLNEQGKIAAKYIKQQIMEERKAFLKEKRKALNEKIKAIRSQLKGLPKEQREILKAQIDETIKGMREQFKEYSAKVRDEYQEKYRAEVEQLKKDKSMRK